ncbi:17932_t:CDS:2, partial [Entrophospora sp. SA101]
NIQFGKITEFYGTLTVTKTTLGIQLCLYDYIEGATTEIVRETA